MVAIAVLSAAVPAFGLPAFARKYNLRCSDCHEAWPKLNNFGQTFKDNGYQLMTGRDAPIYQQISYFPIAFRVTPVWHRESSNRAAVDIIPGNPAGGQTESRVTTNGFNISGLDIWTAGTLYKNISFEVEPDLDNSGSLHLLTYFVRFDNLLNSRWLNLKVKKGVGQFRSRWEKCEIIAIGQPAHNNPTSVVQKAHRISPWQEWNVGKGKRAKIADCKVK
jgi:hypothetical protein